MQRRLPYLVTRSPAIGKRRFKRALEKIELPERLRSRILGQDLHQLDARGGRSEYLWLIDAEFGGEVLEPPALALCDLQVALGRLGTVTGPVASVTADASLARIDPHLVRVASGGRMIWFFHGVEAGFTPIVDFVAYRPFGAEGELSTSFEPPFEELTVSSKTVSGGYASGPDGHYWYEISLVPDRTTGKTAVRRLKCAEQSWFLGREAAGLEVGNPPARGN